MQAELKFLGITQRQISDKIGKSESLISQVLCGKLISEPTLEKIKIILEEAKEDNSKPRIMSTELST